MPRDGIADKPYVVGSSSNFWLWDPRSGWDLTHPATPDAPRINPRLRLNCEISNIYIDPVKTALVIIDMQNYSLSNALGVKVAPTVLKAEETLIHSGIPAARKANIQVIWLNWGLTEETLEKVPPGSIRVFGWKANCEEIDYGMFSNSSPIGDSEIRVHCGEQPQARQPGTDLGEVQTSTGNRVAGRALMRDTWNTELHEPLLHVYKTGLSGPRPDVIIHKDRNSGLYDDECDFAKYLVESGIRTLLFSGMNTDQCVMATLQDAHARGYDTVFLRDACATDSPDYAQQSAVFNCCINWGFVSTCKELAKSAELNAL
ncbi:Isochorismatase hydrolase [Hypoxylon argillaceum]|nr:Isochorismatase hydrolase [Hypoxylon argillaceum]KAI1146127.1 Isochorismatase hydrolase [Nemania diffusa]